MKTPKILSECAVIPLDPASLAQMRERVGKTFAKLRNGRTWPMSADEFAAIAMTAIHPAMGRKEKK